MERLQNPFSLYDFLGYLIPGSFAVYCLLILLSPSNIEWNEVFEHYHLDQVVMIFPFTIISYISGHIISYMSSVTIEKYSIWSVGYPSKYLLGIQNKGYWNLGNKESIKTKDLSIRFFSRLVLVILLLPISLLDFIFGKHCKLRFLYTRELDRFTREVITTNLDRRFKFITDINDPEETGSFVDQNFFLTVYHYCLERAQHHQNKFQNYVAIYGFLRALSFLFILILWSLIIAKFFFEQGGLILPIMIISTLSYITYMGYNKFLRRFSLEVLMAFVSLNKFIHDDQEDEGSKDHHIFTDWIYSDRNQSTD